MKADIPVCIVAALPVAARLQQLGLLGAAAQSFSPSALLTSVPMLAGTAGLSMLYWFHAAIWHFPDTFSRLCAGAPLSVLGPHPVAVFAKLEVCWKFQQAGVLALVLGAAGRADALAAAMAAPLWCWATAAVLFCAGQALNLAMYSAIGNDGVYYGFKLGVRRPPPRPPVPRCHLSRLCCLRAWGGGREKAEGEPLPGLSSTPFNCAGEEQKLCARRNGGWWCAPCIWQLGSWYGSARCRGRTASPSTLASGTLSTSGW
jgi:hypothetical protein